MTADRVHAATRKPRVLALGPFPPFVGGAAKNTAIVCDALESRGAEVIRLPTNKTRSRAEHSRSLSSLTERARGFVSNVYRVASHRSKGDGFTTVYLVPDGGFGVAFSAAYARIAAVAFPRLVIHHRSYNHIRRRSRFMALLLRTAPDKTIHVFLDPAMEAKFISVYAADIYSIYVPNAATCDVSPATPQPQPQVKDRSAVTVGFLSNLVEDKGFDVVADAFPLLAEKLGPSARFQIAGRPVGQRNVVRLDNLKRKLGDRLLYAGEVHGAAKTEFFRTCDVFVFPTRFAQEAQPNVLYEAMAGGAAIVATRWAGVPWVLEGSVSRIIEAGTDRAGELVDAVEDIVISGDLRTAQSRQSAAFHTKKADAESRYERLIGLLLGGDL